MWIGLIGVVLNFGAQAQTIALQWDSAAGDPLVVGYEVRCGLQSGEYQWVVQADADAGATNTATIDGLVPGNTCYFAARSRNSDASLGSTFSNELSVAIAEGSTVPSIRGLVAAYGFEEGQG